MQISRLPLCITYTGGGIDSNSIGGRIVVSVTPNHKQSITLLRIAIEMAAFSIENSTKNAAISLEIRSIMSSLCMLYASVHGGPI